MLSCCLYNDVVLNIMVAFLTCTCCSGNPFHKVGEGATSEAAHAGALDHARLLCGIPEGSVRVSTGRQAVFPIGESSAFIRGLAYDSQYLELKPLSDSLQCPVSVG